MLEKNSRARQSQSRDFVAFRLVPAIAVSVMAVGCGLETYESRLNQTREYYAVLEKHNEYLDNEWIDPETGVRLRVPNQLKPIPGPSAEAGAVRDPRQPDYIQMTFPGLMGAWQGTVAATVNGHAQAAPAYMYVMGNQKMLVGSGHPFPANEFNDEIMERLTTALAIPLPANSDFNDESYPRRPGFLEQKHFHWIRLTPSEPINGVPTDFYVYEHHSGDVRMTIVIVQPQQMDPGEKLHAAVPISFETLIVPQELPAAPAGSGGGGGPTKSRGPSF